MKNNIYYDNKDDINVPAIGLLNYSRVTQRNKNYYFNKNLDSSYLYNICYMNASIQCLLRLDNFIKNIVKCDGGNLTKATQNLIKNMQKKNRKNKSCSVLEIKMAMAKKNEIYKNNEEGDVNEFISNYINGLIEETQDTGKLKWLYSPSDEIYFTKFYNKFLKKKGNSFILDLFYGLLRTENYCKYCKNTFSVKFNTFNILEIPINVDYLSNNPLNMQDLLMKFISEKDDLNEICPECKKHRNYKISINYLPLCLIIYFTRDYIDNKINNIIIPKSFNFVKYMDKNLIKDNDNENDNFFYNLKGIIFYQYSKINLSHYKSVCLGNNMDWYYLDDNHYETKKLLYINDYDNPVFLFYEK